MPAPDDGIVVALAIEFLEAPEIQRCPKCGEDTLQVATAVLTLDDIPQGGPAVYSFCPTCDVDDITVIGRAAP